MKAISTRSVYDNELNELDKDSENRKIQGKKTRRVPLRLPQPMLSIDCKFESLCIKFYAQLDVKYILRLIRSLRQITFLRQIITTTKDAWFQWMTAVGAEHRLWRPRGSLVNFSLKRIEEMPS